MADASIDAESVLDFVTKHYSDLKTKAETDNTRPGPPNEQIKAVIVLIDKLYETIKKGDASHDQIAGQLNELKTKYNELGLTDSYTRYTYANTSLNMIVDGFNEIEAGVESE